MKEKHELTSVNQKLSQLPGAKVSQSWIQTSGFDEFPSDIIPRTHDIHYSLWQILFSAVAIWDNLSARTLPEEGLLRGGAVVRR